MELLIPTSVQVTLGAIGAFVVMLTSILGIYFRLRAQIDLLINRIDKMEIRNTHADQETEVVKAEQASQKTTVAVMAQQVHGIDRTLAEMKAEQKETNTLLRQLISAK